MHCLLCGSDTTLFFVYKARDGQKFFRCTSCGCILLHPDYYVSEEDEKARYLTHNNDVNDKRYQRFVSPIVNAILNDFSKVDEGLDFGSGTGPVISKMLRDEGYQIRTYDPFFDPDTHALSTSYDYIASCEVVEHFHQPAKEFARLSALLRPGGKLYLKTELYDDSIPFEHWRYKDDETHTIIYTEDAFDYIQSTFGYSHVKVKTDLIVLTR